MAECAQSLFPAEVRTDDRICAHPHFQQTTRALWAKYNELKATRSAHIASIFKAWKCFKEFQLMSKRLRLAAKSIRREKILAVEVEIQKAAQRGDHGNVYQGVRKLAPWKPRDHICLRSADGAILDQKNQLQELLTYCRSKFCKTPDCQPDHRLEADFQITEREVAHALARAPAKKAVPSHIAPAAVWRLCASSIAVPLTRALQREWQQSAPGHVPQPWRDAYLILMQQPNKDHGRPEGLRPIGLTRPMAKVVTTVLRSRITPVLQRALRSRPQFTYTAGRGTFDALLRVHGHLRQARSLGLANKQNIRALHAGAKQTRCSGGLDLEAAFDTVPRPMLATCLRRLGIEEGVVHLLIQFHYESCR